MPGVKLRRRLMEEGKAAGYGCALAAQHSDAWTEVVLVIGEDRVDVHAAHQ